MVQEATGKPIFPPYTIRRFQGTKVGFIGLTLEGTPDIVAAAGVQGLQFLDEAETINRYARELRRRQGVRAIVVLLHEGGFQAAPFNINGCHGLAGPVVDIVNASTDAVDMFITGHTHQAYNCVVDGRPVTSASSFGRLFTDIDATLDRRTKDFETIAANNVVVRQTGADGTPVPQAPDIAALVQHYQTLAAPLASRVIGEVAAPATKAPDDTSENQAGNLIADSQQASASTAGTGSVAAFMNPGGVRGDTGFAAGPLTYAQAFAIQPFGNTLVTLTLTGAQPARDAQAAVVRAGERREGAAAVRGGPLHVRPERRHRLRARQGLRHGAGPDHGAHDRRRRGGSGGVLPDHRQQLPRRRRGRVRAAQGRRGPDGRGARSRRARRLPPAVGRGGSGPGAAGARPIDLVP